MIKRFLLLFLLFFIFFSSYNLTFGATSCTTDNECLQSINENTNQTLDDINTLQLQIDDIKTSLSLDEENPITLTSMTQYDETENNITKTLNVFGVFMVLVLFGVFFILAILSGSRS